jgi:hypothetical protein
MARATPSLSKLLQARGVLTERALIEAFVGAPVRGSWWGHPEGKAIFRALATLGEDKDVFICKLLEGKQTYVHRRLWPALLRLQAEASLWPPLTARARRLLARVEEKGSVQATGPVRLELERALRVVAQSRHTASGAHAVVLSPLQGHFPAASCRKAARLTLAEAQAALGTLPTRTASLPTKAGLRTASPGRGKAHREGRR